MSVSVMVGVDGGGTHSRLIAVHTDGSVVARAEGAGINYYTIGMDAARENLYAGVKALMAQLPGAEYKVISVGMSALDCPADSTLMKTFAGNRFVPEKLKMDSDVFMALMGATLGAPGVMVVSGTGAMIVAQEECGRVVSAGGWGYRLDDPGSAYGIAIDGLKAAMLYLEGAGEETQMGAEALAFFGASDSRDLVVRLYGEKITPSNLAKFACNVLKCAEKGDKAARRTLENHMNMLAALTVSQLKRCPAEVDVNLYGGMFEHNPELRDLFADKLRTMGCSAKVCIPQLPPELGAVIAYLVEKKTMTDDLARRMMETWKEEKQ